MGLQKFFLSPHVNCKFWIYLNPFTWQPAQTSSPSSRRAVANFHGHLRRKSPFTSQKRILNISKYFNLFALDPSNWLEKIYCYVPCKCAFYRFISFPEFKSIFPPSDTRYSIIWILPSRVQRAPIIQDHQSNSAEKPMKMLEIKAASCFSLRAARGATCLAAVGKNRVPPSPPSSTFSGGRVGYF